MIKTGFGLVFALAMLLGSHAAASTFHLIYTFSAEGDGVEPSGTMFLGGDGNLYGTTVVGGGGECATGCGIVFKLTPKGDETILYRFQGGSDGANPGGSLIKDKDGNFYGATAHGGGEGCGAGLGCGTIFKLAPDGTETVLHAFTDGADGSAPAGLMLATSGDLYGITFLGGRHKQGTVFKVSTATGELTTLYAFCTKHHCRDGAGPLGGLVEDSTGNLYGTTRTGGAFETYGTIFKLSPNGKLKTLHSFDYTDGSYPATPLILDADGNLYGTNAGRPNSTGGIYKLAPDGTLSTLHDFQSTEGAELVGIVMTPNGDFYGAAAYGGGDCAVSNCGTVFKLAKNGTFTVLHQFADDGDGFYPNPVILGPHGSLYGSSSGGGTVFKIKP
jgi:uncharacterized repeat protein (TIGR03803 family)